MLSSSIDCYARPKQVLESCRRFSTDVSSESHKLNAENICIATLYSKQYGFKPNDALEFWVNSYKKGAILLFDGMEIQVHNFTPFQAIILYFYM